MKFGCMKAVVFRGRLHHFAIDLHKQKFTVPDEALKKII
jgi:hypothetical protein